MKKTWLIAIIATIIILGGVFLIPNIEKVPHFIIPLVYTAIAQYLVQRFQGTAIKAHIEKGGQVYSIWRTGWIGLTGLLILVVIVFIIILFTNHATK